MQEATRNRQEKYANLDVDTRILELINKTNQFNLNGVRYTESEWRNSLEDARQRAEDCITSVIRPTISILIAPNCGEAERL